MSNDYPIEPETKIAALLEHYAELEDVLISMAPPFRKLKNPILRRSVAKVASLRQAAVVARIPVDELVNRLRAAVGQPQTGGTEKEDENNAYFTGQPKWFDEIKVVKTFVESDLDTNVMPLTPLLEHARKMQEGEIVELITTYLPAPGIDIMKEKGFQTWSMARGEFVKSYFCRPARRSGAD